MFYRFYSFSHNDTRYVYLIPDKKMSGRHESFTAEYCTGETVTLYSQQHHTRIHLQTHVHANNHIPLNQSKIPYFYFEL